MQLLLCVLGGFAAVLLGAKIIDWYAGQTWEAERTHLQDEIDE